MAQEHVFEGTLAWIGMADGQPFGPDTYPRTTALEFRGGASITASAPAPFKGDDTRPNPETLMLASLMQCHFLTFMAVAAKAGATVLDYTDRASGRIAIRDGRMRYVEVTLNPKVRFADSAHVERLASFHEKAHANCFMANSVNFPVVVNPEP